MIPYDQRLGRFPAYLQQLDMESNGKHVHIDGSVCHESTGPVVWGEPGTNGQHAFFQLLHQGTEVVPIDFLVAAEPTDADLEHHQLLVANCLAQSQALMVGRTTDEVKALLEKSGMAPDAIAALAPHKQFDGNRPTSTFMYRKLDPRMLGPPHRALRAPGLHHGGDLGHQTPSINGAWNSARNSPTSWHRSSRTPPAPTTELDGSTAGLVKQPQSADRGVTLGRMASASFDKGRPDPAQRTDEDGVRSGVT